MKKYMSFFVLSIAVFLLQNTCIGQPFSLDERIKPTELNLVDYKKQDSLRRGKINITEVTQVKDTAYYFVKGISMYSPAYFGLTTKADSGNIKVVLCKDNWKTPNRQGETGSKGHYQELFKTEGDFGIMVVLLKKPANYTMVTWVGKEAKDVGIVSPFKGDDAPGSLSKENSKGNFFKKNLLYIVIAVLLIVIAFLFVKRKKTTK